MEKILIFALLLNVSHYLADYVFPSDEMIIAKKHGSPILPIFKHGLVNASFYIIISFFFCTFWFSVFVFLIEAVSHTLIDTWKGKMNMWFPTVEDKEKRPHYIIMGLDQLFHQAVIILIIYLYPTI
jgi:hypothetical protein